MLLKANILSNVYSKINFIKIKSIKLARFDILKSMIYSKSMILIIIGLPSVPLLILNIYLSTKDSVISNTFIYYLLFFPFKNQN